MAFTSQLYSTQSSKSAVNHNHPLVRQAAIRQILQQSLSLTTLEILLDVETSAARQEAVSQIQQHINSGRLDHLIDTNDILIRPAFSRLEECITERLSCLMIDQQIDPFDIEHENPDVARIRCNASRKALEAIHDLVQEQLHAQKVPFSVQILLANVKIMEPGLMREWCQSLATHLIQQGQSDRYFLDRISMLDKTHGKLNDVITERFRLHISTIQASELTPLLDGGPLSGPNHQLLEYIIFSTDTPARYPEKLNIKALKNALDHRLAETIKSGQQDKYVTGLVTSNNLMTTHAKFSSNDMINDAEAIRLSQILHPQLGLDVLFHPYITANRNSQLQSVALNKGLELLQTTLNSGDRAPFLKADLWRHLSAEVHLVLSSSLKHMLNRHPESFKNNELKKIQSLLPAKHELQQLLQETIAKLNRFSLKRIKRILLF